MITKVISEKGNAERFGLWAKEKDLKIILDNKEVNGIKELIPITKVSVYSYDEKLCNMQKIILAKKENNFNNDGDIFLYSNQTELELKSFVKELEKCEEDNYIIFMRPNIKKTQKRG